MKRVMVKRPGVRELSCAVRPKEEKDKPLNVEFKIPAQNFTDAIPIDNGRLRAMVWGCVQSTTLILNEDTLWTRISGDYMNPEASMTLAEIRKLVDNGKYYESTTIAAPKLFNYSPEAYQPLGDMKLKFNDSHSSYSQESYSEDLDLNTTTARVKYSVGDIEFTREHFASYPDQVIGRNISASKPGSLSFTIYLDSKLHHSSFANVLNGKKYQMIPEGSCVGRGKAPRTNENLKSIQFRATIDTQGSDNIGSYKILNGTTFRVEGSDWVILRMVASSSFDGPFVNSSESKRDPSLECVKYSNSIENLLCELYATDLVDYQTLFRRVFIELSKSDTKSGEVAKVLTAESFQTDEDTSLVALLFQYGQYVSSSRTGTQISNLQKSWSWKISPAWKCVPHLNINLQMNYWSSLAVNWSKIALVLTTMSLVSYVQAQRGAPEEVRFKLPQEKRFHVPVYQTTWKKITQSKLVNAAIGAITVALVLIFVALLFHVIKRRNNGTPQVRATRDQVQPDPNSSISLQELDHTSNMVELSNIVIVHPDRNIEYAVLSSVRE